MIERARELGKIYALENAINNGGKAEFKPVLNKVMGQLRREGLI